MKTQHDHDCYSCRFLGNFSISIGDQSRKYDAYMCPNAHGGPEYIARFGSNGPEYVSISSDMLQDHARNSDVWTGVLNLIIRFMGSPPTQ